MTVTNCFPRKEDLVFDQADAVIGQLARTIGSRAASESYLAAVRRAYLAERARADGTTGITSAGFAAINDRLTGASICQLKRRRHVHVVTGRPAAAMTCSRG